MLAANLDGGALSYDSFAAVKTGEHGIVRFHYSLRSAADAVLERFVTELHGPILQRPVTEGEHAALLAFGVFHSTYALLPFATAVRKLQIRAGRVSEGQLSFFQTALEGALAEFYYLADMDLACALRVECCFDAAGEQQKQGMQQEQRQGMQQEQVPTALAQQHCQGQQQQPEQTQQQQQREHPSPDQQALQSQQASPDQQAPSNQQAPSDQQVPPDQQAPSNPHAPAGQQLGQEAGSGCRPKLRVLVPFGGGKDSTLLMQLLHECGCDTQWAYFGEWLGSWGGYPKFDRLVAASPCKSVLVAEQNLPCLERLTTLNLRPDIHFPDYVAYVSYYVFSAAFLALQHGYDYICVGNEHSANVINLVHPNM